MTQEDDNREGSRNGEGCDLLETLTMVERWRVTIVIFFLQEKP